MSNPDLGHIQIVEPRELWEDEARDFTPWLAENAQQLSEAIGIPIEIDSTEKEVGDFNLDIYGTIEGTDKRVAIENQLEYSDHKHLGQLITYSAGLDASVVIWITPNIRQEHKDAIDWLNDISSDEVSFFLVRPEVMRIDSSKPAVRFIVEAQPSDFLNKVKEFIGTEEGPRQRYRRQFWQEFLNYLYENGVDWAKNRKTTKDTWLYSAGGKTGVEANIAMGPGAKIRTEITLSHQDPEVNKQRYQVLIENKERLEEALGTTNLSWEPREDIKVSRVAIYRDHDKERVLNDENYKKELFAWLMKHLMIMRKLAREVLG
ncbi:MAG: DUF4268 domain-containing protein [Bacteroidales bacterium]|nr:DUF4268 domain-containing protein [Bacteroidales bacterium]MCF8334550.1 DUF4268 domain-containing protein [Bacteroidales bacterium]